MELYSWDLEQQISTSNGLPAIAWVLMYPSFISNMKMNLMIFKSMKMNDKKYVNKKERERHLPGYCQ